MDDDWELEDWLLDAGERAERKRIDDSDLSAIERLTREFWAFDMQALNGGVSQYFCNYSRAEWQAFKDSWLPTLVPSLGPVFVEIDRTIGETEDPFLAVLDAENELDALYRDRRVPAWRELRAVVEEGRMKSR